MAGRHRRAALPSGPSRSSSPTSRARPGCCRSSAIGRPALLETHRRSATGGMERPPRRRDRHRGRQLLRRLRAGRRRGRGRRAAQRALAAHDWPDDGEIRVRMGMHTGEVDIVDGDYVGLAVHLAARVSAGRPRRAGAAHRTPPGAWPPTSTPSTSASTGSRTSTAGADLPAARRRPAGSFPPLRSLTATPNNLPAAVDEFIGREQEIADIIDRARRGPARHPHRRRRDREDAAGDRGRRRVVHRRCPTGRLAGRAGGDDRSRPGGDPRGSSSGWWIAGPHAAGEPRRVAARAASCSWSSTTASTSSIGRRRGRRTILAAVPGVRILATSRERLGVRGEHTIAVPPLDAGADGRLAIESDAVRLFVARARAGARRSIPSRSELAQVASICRRIDGLPLAIELAAARLRTLSVAAARRAPRRRLPPAGIRRSAASHLASRPSRRSWRGATSSSTPEERTLFARLTVFPDSFGLDAAEGSAPAGPSTSSTSSTSLTRLVDKSLVSTVPSDEGIRYQVLETLAGVRVGAPRGDGRDGDAAGRAGGLGAAARRCAGGGHAGPRAGRSAASGPARARQHPRRDGVDA